MNYQHLILIAVSLAKRALLSPRMNSVMRLRALELFESWVDAGYITSAQLQAVEPISDLGFEMIDAARALDRKPWPADNFSPPPSLRVLDESWEHLAKVSPSLAAAAELRERRDAVAELH